MSAYMWQLAGRVVTVFLALAAVLWYSVKNGKIAQISGITISANEQKDITGKPSMREQGVKELSEVERETDKCLNETFMERKAEDVIFHESIKYLY